MTSIEQARRIAALAQEKLAKDVVILDMQPVCSYTDFFVLCSGNSQRQTKAIWDEVHARLKQEVGVIPRSIAESDPNWIVADYLNVILHVFTPQVREFYGLDELWGDAPKEIPEAATA